MRREIQQLDPGQGEVVDCALFKSKCRGPECPFIALLPESDTCPVLEAGEASVKMLKEMLEGAIAFLGEAMGITHPDHMLSQLTRAIQKDEVDWEAIAEQLNRLDVELAGVEVLDIDDLPDLDI